MKEDGVIARHIGVLLWTALDLGIALARSPGGAIDGSPRAGERQMVKADPVAVIWKPGLRLALAQTE
jgi:hypothetical protein